MRGISYLFIIFSLTISSAAFAQMSPVPNSYSLKTPDDYKKYERDVVNVIDWLERTPWGPKNTERPYADAFLMAWLSGSPTVNIELGDDILLKIMEKNKDLLVSYMGGYTKYALQNRQADNALDTNKAKLAGFKALIAKYNTEKSRNKDKNVEMLAQLDSEGKLEEWVNTELAKK
ncbi:hypothetical protein [Mucilaginibacter auburnensis]|uniref:Uncharacterized protein n=1 Tax=Mucilaginibacter auburnensis TaxID=1457233 RepID=A0A2H9VUV5_9SPHI|nr:hypothetical protein [Mucilaginibacter auburnensis]PJJ84579.1 hypothetical protein CLV57_1593 [Mucilaginibacter auburnensis]